MGLPCAMGCGQDASHALQIACGTFTDPDDMPPRAKILMGVLVCEPCLDKMDAGPWMESNPDLGRLLAIAMSGGPPPDLGRAVILGVPIGSEEYREWQIAHLNHLRN